LMIHEQARLSIMLRHVQFSFEYASSFNGSPSVLISRSVPTSLPAVLPKKL
jgi:hypothetical protein